MRAIELLSPARNLECGIEAIRHGADAVYIGAPRFGARAAAGNSVEDIARLVEFARPFGVRIYVTLNTLLRDDELPAAQALINELAAVGVTALIVQDPRIVPFHNSTISQFEDSTISQFDNSTAEWSNCKSSNRQIISPLPLHSSTQMDNRTVEDIRARLAAGYQQTVLARELSLEEIRAIHVAVPEMPLEVFIHGALCVSYSGRCYASEYCFNRSANRGECAQFCRLPFDLVDAEGHIITFPEGSPSVTNASRPFTVPEGSPEGLPLRQRHLLSLRDMNRAADLEALMDAGASSFKIEGRLKDVSYVKNITAYYRQRIDAIINRRPNDFCRASRGVSTVSFTPNPLKSFNRGFTDYFLHTGTSAATPATAPLHQHLTPKFLGEPIGTVKEISIPVTPPSNRRFSTTGRVRGGFPAAASPSFTLSTSIPIHNGDGLCFFTSDGHLQGFRINRVDEQGRLIPADPASLTQLHRGTPLFRNLDADFERQLARPTAERRIPVRWLIEDSFSLSADTQKADTQHQPTGFRITISTLEASPITASRFFPYPLEPARTPQTDNLRRQLLRLGDTPFSATEADITLHLSNNWFIPSSTLADWRRQLTEKLNTLICKRPSIQQLGDTFSVDFLDGNLSADPSDTAAIERRRFHRLEDRTSNVKTGTSINQESIELSSHETVETLNQESIELSSHKTVETSNRETVQLSNYHVLMTCRYCLRHALGLCTKTTASSLTPDCRKVALPPSPWSLRLSDGRRFPLRFDCKNCLMYVLAPDT